MSFVGVAVVCSHRHSHRHRSPRYRSFSIKSIGSQPKLKLVDCSIPKSAGPLHLRSFSFASVYLWPCTSAFVCVHSGFLFHSNRRSTPPSTPYLAGEYRHSRESIFQLLPTLALRFGDISHHRHCLFVHGLIKKVAVVHCFLLCFPPRPFAAAASVGDAEESRREATAN